MRHITQRGLDLIKRFEGFEPNIYLDAAGLATIGYGHLLKAGERPRFANGITEAKGEVLLMEDVGFAERAVQRLITVPLTDGQFDALVSFTFNLGAGALERSTLRRLINQRRYSEVPAQFLRWVNAGGRRLRGLVRRREAEAELFMRCDSKVSKERRDH